MRSETLEHWSAVLTVAFGLLAAFCGFGIYYFGKRVQAEKEAVASQTEAQLRRTEAELKERLDIIHDFAEVSKLNFAGTTGTALPPLVEHTSISRLLESAVEISGTTSRYRCDPKSLQTFKDAAVRFPRFPFSYYALASCLQQSGDGAWREQATKAVEILRKTTTIDGHHPNHDQALGELEQTLR